MLLSIVSIESCNPLRDVVDSTSSLLSFVYVAVERSNRNLFNLILNGAFEKMSHTLFLYPSRPGEMQGPKCDISDTSYE